MNVRKLARADTREDSGNTLVLTGVFLAFFFVMSVQMAKYPVKPGTVTQDIPQHGHYEVLICPAAGVWNIRICNDAGNAHRRY